MLRGVNNGDEREAGGKAKEFGDSLNTREGSTSERHRGCLDPALSSKARLRDDWVNLCKAPTGIGLLPEIGVLLPWNPATIPSSLGKVCDSGEEQGVIIISGAAVSNGSGPGKPYVRRTTRTTRTTCMFRYGVPYHVPTGLRRSRARA